MTVQEAVAILRAHNEWRRGNTTESLHDPMPYSPAELGVAIDVLCDHVDSPHAPNPPHFDSQFAILLAWLVRQTDVHINGECVATQHGIHNYRAGDTGSFKQAVYEAALRVVAGN